MLSDITPSIVLLLVSRIRISPFHPFGSLSQHAGTGARSGHLVLRSLRLAQVFVRSEAMVAVTRATKGSPRSPWPAQVPDGPEEKIVAPDTAENTPRSPWSAQVFGQPEEMATALDAKRIRLRSRRLARVICSFEEEGRTSRCHRGWFELFVAGPSHVTIWR